MPIALDMRSVRSENLQRPGPVERAILSTTRRVYQDIARTISQQIDNGELNAGDLLPSERVLAEMHRASRTSVREALLSLESSGLISLRQRARARVTRRSLPEPA